MKAILIEPLLVVTSLLLWILLLPLAVVIHVGIAVRDRVEALKPREIRFALLG